MANSARPLRPEDSWTSPNVPEPTYAQLAHILNSISEAADTLENHIVNAAARHAEGAANAEVYACIHAAKLMTRAIGAMAERGLPAGGFRGSMDLFLFGDDIDTVEQDQTP